MWTDLLETLQNSEGDWDKVNNPEWRKDRESKWVLEEKLPINCAKLT